MHKSLWYFAVLASVYKLIIGFGRWDDLIQFSLGSFMLAMPSMAPIITISPDALQGSSNFATASEQVHYYVYLNTETFLTVILLDVRIVWRVKMQVQFVFCLTI